MAIAYDTSVSDWATQNTPFTKAFTVGAAGADRILLVTASFAGAQAPTSVTYAGIAMTQYASKTIGGAQGTDIYMYYLLGPPVGTANIVLNFSGGSDQVGLVATSYTGVDQANPFLGAAQTESGTTDATSLDINVASQLNDMAIAHYVCVSLGAGSGVLAVGAGETERLNNDSDAAGGSLGFGASEEAGASSVAMSWDPTNTEDHGMICVSLRRSTAAPKRAVRYTIDAYDAAKRIRDPNGRTVPGYEVEADAWGRIGGLLLPSPERPNSLLDDPSAFYIEGAEYDDDTGALTIETSRGQLGEVMLRRVTQGSTG